MCEFTVSSMSLAAVSHVNQQGPWAEAGRAVRRKLHNNTDGMGRGLKQAGNSRGSENYSDSEYILKVEQI